MFIATPPANTPVIEFVQTKGMSTIAQNLDDKLKSIFKDLRHSVALDAGLNSSLQELEELKSECAMPNWDGYGAHTLDSNSYTLAKSFLGSLPLGMTAPSVSADPDGQVTLEWYKSPRKLVSISFDPSGILHYASIIGGRKTNGSEPFIGNIPRIIMNLAHEISA